MIETTDTIEGSGYPLAFRHSVAGPRPVLFGTESGKGVFRVEARAMGGHQKEAIITEGDGAGAWRVVSDEGSILGGSDLAPFPLGFFSAGIQGDLLGRVETLARLEGIAFDGINIELENRYAFTGSFFAGTGQGSTEPAQINIAARTSNSTEAVVRLLRAAVAASPAIAALRQPLENTFAIYVNGKRGSVEGVHSSTAPDARDPFKAHAKAPAPLPDAGDDPALIVRLREPESAARPLPSSGNKVELIVGGEGAPVTPGGPMGLETWLAKPAGTRFGLRSDERAKDEKAPCGLALLSAGLSFCYLTQLLRYVEYRKYKVRAIRLVQFNPYALEGSAVKGTLRGIAGAVDTHLFLTANESEAVMQQLLLYSARTCYLHAALSSAFAPVVTYSLNGGTKAVLL